LGAEGEGIHPSIHQRATDTKEKHREEADDRRKSSSCLGDGLGPCPSRHGWPCVVKPWWSSGAHALIPSRQLYILNLMVI
jgi:hypothetical protein